MKILVSCVSAHQMMTLSEEILRSGRRLPNEDFSQPPSPATELLNGLVKVVAMAAVREDTGVKQHDFCLLRSIWHQPPTEYSGLQSYRAVMSPWYAMYLEKKQPASVAGWLHWIAFIVKGVIDTDNVFAFSACNTSVKTISELTECLIHHSIFHSIISGLGTHFVSKYSSVSMLTVFTGFTMLLKQLLWQNNGMMYWRQLRVKWVAVSWSTGTVSSRYNLYSQSVISVWCCFSKSRDSWVQKSEESEVNYITLLLVIN